LLEILANDNTGALQPLRFLETRLGCGLMQRRFGSDEMLWSRGMFTLLDLDPEIDKPSFSLLQSMQHPDDRLTFDEVESRSDAAIKVARKFRVIRRDGTLRILSQHAEMLFDRDGIPDRLISVVVDVTHLEAERDEASASSKEAIVLPTGVQIRAARAILRWSVQKLSEAGSVSPSVVRRIEEFDGTTEGASASLQSIRHALEAAGIEFLFPRTGKPSVRLY